MSTLTLQERVQQEIEALPPFLLEEILDFILFVKTRRAEEDFLWQQVEETRAYRRQNPEEVMTVTAEGWQASFDAFIKFSTTEKPAEVDIDSVSDEELVDLVHQVREEQS